jgi:hypothetical protein
VTTVSSELLVERFGKRVGNLAATDLAAFNAGLSKHPRPLIVPIRFIELDAAAEDLIPIQARVASDVSRKRTFLPKHA